MLLLILLLMYGNIVLCDNASIMKNTVSVNFLLMIHTQRFVTVFYFAFKPQTARWQLCML